MADEKVKLAAVGTMLFDMCPHAFIRFVSVLESTDPTINYDSRKRDIFEKILSAIEANDIAKLEQLLEEKPSASFSITLVKDDESGTWIQDS